MASMMRKVVVTRTRSSPGRDCVAGQQVIAVENKGHDRLEKTFSFQQEKTNPKSVEKWGQGGQKTQECQEKKWFSLLQYL